MKIQKTYKQALKDHKENNLQNAEKLYNEISGISPILDKWVKKYKY